ncbi:Hermansky-Pudlak syndrome 6 protein-like [Anguilla anguilla]|uniref:Hermansky-Pudlak syndrome 6 protein-like n=1 Tax=Anguilla anguilla TaxID=7936 RepID=UPI0015ADF85A|nr:Hermansky-Pudlak syndrome 6 protein-like [Anguilla anguilla]
MNIKYGQVVKLATNLKYSFLEREQADIIQHEIPEQHSHGIHVTLKLRSEFRIQCIFSFPVKHFFVRIVNMKRLTVELLTDFNDFTGGKDLSDFLKRCYSDVTSKNELFDIRLSPDGHHIHAIRRKAKTELITFDKCRRTRVIQDKTHLDSGLTRTVPLSDLIYLECGSRDGDSAVLAVVFENGKTEFWKYSERKGGWNLLQTSDLCKSPRAKIFSVCASATCIIWCEERDPSKSSSALNATGSKFRYCICKRNYEIGDVCVRLGGAKVLLHSNPCYRVITSGDNAYLLPEVKENSLAGGITKVFLTWSLQYGTVAVNSACQGALMRKHKLTSKDSDFKVLISECMGARSTISPVEICACSPAEHGGLLLLLSSGWVSVLQNDGVLRQVYKLADNCLPSCGADSSISIHGDVLALTLKSTLYLIDVRCGLELEKISLKTRGVLFDSCLESCTIHLLCESGLFVIRHRDLESGQKLVGHSESLRLGSVLVEAVFEEACRYYQQRSLSSTQLTVEKLKSCELFQAPIALSSILRDYLSSKKTGNNPALEAGSYSKLRLLLETKLQSLVALEDLKMAVVGSSDRDLEGHCETLVQKEVSRLLSSEMDRQNMLYLNRIFSTFPSQAWQALQSVFQLRCKGDGSLSAEAPSEVWKTALSPTHYPAQAANLHPQPSDPAANAAVPVFELLCRSFFHFQPCWLPRFVELAQQQASSCSSSSWSCLVEETPGSAPLYKRALSVLPGNREFWDLEVELLLCSRRPKAVMQALWILIRRQQWGRVTQVAQSFSRQSPLLNKEIFTALLCEVTQHRDLDPNLDLLWALCPEDLTVVSILDIVLKNLPASVQGGAPYPAQSTQLTIGFLKPLLRKVLQRETRPSWRYVDILQSPYCPPPTPPREAKGLPRALTDRAMDLHDHIQNTMSSGASVMPQPPHV